MTVYSATTGKTYAFDKSGNLLRTGLGLKLTSQSMPYYGLIEWAYVDAQYKDSLRTQFGALGVVFGWKW